MIAEGLLGRLRAKDARRRGRGAVASRPGDRDRVRSRARSGRRRVGRRARLSLLCLAVLVALLGAGWLWFRDSSLVAVDHVTVTGQTGLDSGQIRAALVAAARSMTTLDVRTGRLRTAVAPYPVVRDLRVSAEFPHGIRIEVIERSPVGAVLIGGRSIAVAGDGTFLYDVPVSSSLPMIPLPVPPGGKRVTDAKVGEEIALLAAAPQPLLAKVSQVTTDGPHGLVAQIRGGPSVYFGAASELEAKWVSAEAVLADPGSAGAQYIDVTDPQRPVAGTATAQSPTSAAAAASSQSPASPGGAGSSQSTASGSTGSAGVGGG